MASQQRHTPRQTLLDLVGSGLVSDCVRFRSCQFAFRLTPVGQLRTLKSCIGIAKNLRIAALISTINIQFSLPFDLYVPFLAKVKSVAKLN
jgi:hypothetical protein